MGNNSSSLPQTEQTPRFESDIEQKTSPISISFLETLHLDAALSPLDKLPGDSEVDNGDQSGAESDPIEESKSVKNFSRLLSNNCDKGTVEMSSARHSKKGVSFFNLNSMDNPVNHLEFSSQNQGDEWKLQNIKLDSFLHKNNGRYIWEAHSMITEKKCTVKISIIDRSRLASTNLSKSEWILKELGAIKHSNVAEIYSFSIWESEFHKKPGLAIVILQELVKCSLRDLQTFNAETRQNWTQNQILTILHDVYSGLVACKERNLIHGKLLLENILLSENLDRALIADFDLKLPFVGERKAISAGKSLFSKYINTEIQIPEAEKVLEAPDEKDIHDLVVLILKLVTMDENVGFEYDILRKDERYRRTYVKTFEALDSMVRRIKSPSLVLKELEQIIGDTSVRHGLNFPKYYKLTNGEETPVDVLFTKIDCYELMNNHAATADVYADLVKILDSKDIKGPKECEEYVKCVNKTIKHYLEVHNWLKAKEVSQEFSNLLKTNASIKRVLKTHPKEYICFLFLAGNLCEELKEEDRAISLYTKGLAYCSRASIDLELFSSSLKKLAHLYLKKKDFVQALESLKKLVAFYETQEGYYSDKVEVCSKIGDIHILQDQPTLGVKMYLKSFESFKKGKLSNDLAILEVLQKIIQTYRNLSEDDNALAYMMTLVELKKHIFGPESVEYLEELKEVGDAQEKKKDYQGALDTYITYHKICSKVEIMREQYAESLVYLGDVYLKVLQYGEAKDKFKTYSDIQEQLKGKVSREYLQAQDKLADIAFRQKDFTEALNIQLTSLSIKEEILGDDDIYRAISISNIGDTYLALGQVPKALEYHKKSFEILQIRSDVYGQECSAVLLKIAYDHETLGDSWQAIAAVNNSFQMSGKQAYGTDMEETIKLYEMLNRIKETKVATLEFSGLTQKPE